MYASDLTFDEAYFSGGRDSGYSRYTPDTLPFDRRAAAFESSIESAGIDPTSVTVALFGCGYGYTVEELRALGVDAFGVDISDHAVAQGSSAIEQGDLLGKNVMKKISRDPDVVLTESLLECFDATGRQTAFDNISKAKPQHVAHVVSPSADPQYYTAKTPDEWQSTESSHDWISTGVTDSYG